MLVTSRDMTLALIFLVPTSRLSTAVMLHTRHRQA
jgi:hypothetical protein